MEPSSRSPRPNPSSTAATTNATAAAITTDSSTPNSPPRGVIAMYAKMLPGEGEATSPLDITTLVSTPAAPPAIAAMIRRGFIRMYGK